MIPAARAQRPQGAAQPNRAARRCGVAQSSRAERPHLRGTSLYRARAHPTQAARQRPQVWRFVSSRMTWVPPTTRVKGSAHGTQRCWEPYGPLDACDCLQQTGVLVRVEDVVDLLEDAPGGAEPCGDAGEGVSAHDGVGAWGWWCFTSDLEDLAGENAVGVALSSAHASGCRTLRYQSRLA
jgi:hypothetical protein